jgi:putative transposase
MSDRMTSDLTIAALEMALLQRQSGVNLIHHSDQGSQYTDRKYQALSKGHGIRASMNCAGSWYDNAPMESFFGTLRNELVHHCVYYTRNKAKADVFYYIESSYNRCRGHSALDYLSPEVYEQLSHQGVLTCLTPCPPNRGRIGEV